MLPKDARLYQIAFLSLFLLLGIGTRDWTLKLENVVVAIVTCLGVQVVGSLVIRHWSFVIGGWGRQEAGVRSQEPEGANGSWLNPSRLRHGYAKAPLFCASDQWSLVSEVRAATEQMTTDQGQMTSPTTDQGQMTHQTNNRGQLTHTIFHSLPSALITALGLSLLLRADHPVIMALAGTVAILSKFLLRVGDKHVFNPANLGIAAALLITQDAWVSPGQWGDEQWYALLFLGAGGLVLQKVGRWDTSIAFLSSYALLEAIRNAWLGWPWDLWAHRLMSGSLLLFALFMVTDPRTIPNHRVARIIWSIAIALITFILRNYFFISTAVFWALLFMSPFSLLLDSLLPAPQFKWRCTEIRPLHLPASASIHLPTP